MTTNTDHTAPLMASVSGVRGVVGASLTPETVCRFTGALAAWLAENEAGDAVILGRDGRKGGDVVAACAAAAFRAAGFRVIDLGVATTPTVGLMVKRYAAAGGLAITASHNPAEWNGLKPITARGAAPSPDQAAEILARFHAGKTLAVPHDKLGALDADDTAAHAHVAAVLEALSPLCPIDRIAERRFSVALDAVNASGSLPGPMLLEALGCSVERVACDGSGVFPHTPEPTEENLRSLTSAAKGRAAAFAQDPDADRLAVIDETGRYIGEEYTLALCARAILTLGKSGGEAAVLAANLSTSRMIDDVAAKAGATVARAPVGEANVVATMREKNAILGGEGNGGVVWPAVVEIRDSLSSMALVLALMAAENRPLSQIVADLPAYAIVKRKTPIREGLAPAAVAALKKKHASESLDEQDGLRIDFADPPSWVHVRPSNTEPILRVIAEAPTQADADRIADDAEALIATL